TNLGRRGRSDAHVVGGVDRRLLNVCLDPFVAAALSDVVLGFRGPDGPRDLRAGAEFALAPREGHRIAAGIGLDAGVVAGVQRQSAAVGVDTVGPGDVSGNLVINRVVGTGACTRECYRQSAASRTGSRDGNTKSERVNAGIPRVWVGF